MRNIFPNIIYLELDGSIFSCSSPLELTCVSWSIRGRNE